MRKLLFALLCLMLLLTATAYGADITDEQWESFDTEDLEEAVEGYLDDVELDSSINFNDGLARVWEDTSAVFGEIVSASVKSGLLLILVVIACGLGEIVTKAAGGTALPVIHMAGALSVTAIAVSDIHSLMSMGANIINQLSSFTAVLMPVMTSAAVACGHPTSATVRQMATLLCSNILTSVIQYILLPGVYVYVAISAASAALENDNLKPLCSFIKWVICSVLTAMLFLFVSYITVSGAVSGTADSTTVKAAKLAISGMVPVVGSILSDATETVLAGAGVLRNAVGIFGMLAVFAFCAVPFLRLGCQYLIYKLAYAVSGIIAEGRTGKLIGELSSVFGIVLGMTGTCALVVLVSIVATVSVAVT